MTEVVIRDAHPSDAECIAAIHEAAVQSQRGCGLYADAEIDAWAQIRSPDESRELMATRRFFIAESDDCPVAYAIVDLDAATLRSVYVHPDSQGLGLGRRLVAQALGEAREAGLGRLELDAAPSSVSFYEGLGFSTMGDVEHSFRDGVSMTCVRMACDVTAMPRG